MKDKCWSSCNEAAGQHDWGQAHRALSDRGQHCEVTLVHRHVWSQSPTSYPETVVLLSMHVDVRRRVSPKIKGGYPPCLEVAEMML